MSTQPLTTSPMDVTDAERAFIGMIRSLGGGYIEGLGVKSFDVQGFSGRIGQPEVAKNVTARINFLNTEERDVALATFESKLLIPKRGEAQKT